LEKIKKRGERTGHGLVSFFPSPPGLGGGERECRMNGAEKRKGGEEGEKTEYLIFLGGRGRA